MPRFQREIYNQHAGVYKVCEVELDKARDDFAFKTRANQIFSKSKESDKKVQS